MPKVIIVYDSKTGNTESLAKAIAEGTRSAGGVNVVMRKIGEAFPLNEFETADALIFGSPAYYANVTIEMRNLLESIESLSENKRINLKDKLGAAFGTYGWDGGVCLEEALQKTMEKLGIKLINPVLLSVEEPSEKVLEQSRDFGKRIAEEIKKK
jgi:flavorubredoxin